MPKGEEKNNENIPVHLASAGKEETPLPPIPVVMKENGVWVQRYAIPGYVGSMNDKQSDHRPQGGAEYGQNPYSNHGRAGFTPAEQAASKIYPTEKMKKAQWGEEFADAPEREYYVGGVKEREREPYVGAPGDNNKLRDHNMNNHKYDSNEYGANGESVSAINRTDGPSTERKTHQTINNQKSENRDEGRIEYLERKIMELQEELQKQKDNAEKGENGKVCEEDTREDKKGPPFHINAMTEQEAREAEGITEEEKMPHPAYQAAERRATNYLTRLEERNMNQMYGYIPNVTTRKIPKIKKWEPNDHVSLRKRYKDLMASPLNWDALSDLQKLQLLEDLLPAKYYNVVYQWVHAKEPLHKAMAEILRRCDMDFKKSVSERIEEFTDLKQKDDETPMDFYNRLECWSMNLANDPNTPINFTGRKIIKQKFLEGLNKEIRRECGVIKENTPMEEILEYVSKCHRQLEKDKKEEMRGNSVGIHEVGVGTTGGKQDDKGEPGNNGRQSNNSEGEGYPQRQNSFNRNTSVKGRYPPKGNFGNRNQSNNFNNNYNRNRGMSNYQRARASGDFTRTRYPESLTAFGKENGEIKINMQNTQEGRRAVINGLQLSPKQFAAWCYDTKRCYHCGQPHFMRDCTRQFPLFKEVEYHSNATPVAGNVALINAIDGHFPAPDEEEYKCIWLTDTVVPIASAYLADYSGPDDSNGGEEQENEEDEGMGIGAYLCLPIREGVTDLTLEAMNNLGKAEDVTIPKENPDKDKTKLAENEIDIERLYATDEPDEEKANELFKIPEQSEEFVANVLTSTLKGECPNVRPSINGKPTLCMLDSGAAANIINMQTYYDHFKDTAKLHRCPEGWRFLTAAKGKGIDFKGYCTLRVKYDHIESDVNFLVADIATHVTVLLGSPYLKKNCISICGAGTDECWRIYQDKHDGKERVRLHTLEGPKEKRVMQVKLEKEVERRRVVKVGPREAVLAKVPMPGFVNQTNLVVDQQTLPSGLTVQSQLTNVENGKAKIWIYNDAHVTRFYVNIPKTFDIEEATEIRDLPDKADDGKLKEIMELIHKQKQNARVEKGEFGEPLAGDDMEPVDFVSEYDDEPEIGVVDHIFYTAVNTASEMINRMLVNKQIAEDKKESSEVFRNPEETATIHRVTSTGKKIWVTKEE